MGEVERQTVRTKQTGQCKAENCNDTRVFTKGLCRKHYNHLYRYGHIKESTVADPNKIEVKGKLAYLSLRNSQGKTVQKAIIDAEDVDKVKGYKWKVDGKRVVAKDKSYCLLLHRCVLNLADDSDKYVNFNNDNFLDCSKENLKTVDRAKMGLNCKLPITNTSGYKGVSWDKPRNKWVAYLHVAGKKINGGGYSNIHNAVNARMKLESKYL
jgi:hypothetical protein